MASKRFHWHTLLLPRVQDVLFISLLTAVTLYGPRLLNQDGDLGRHITVGRYILESHVIPTADIFSHSLAGSSLVPHEWLSQVLFALAYRIMGLDGDVLLSALVIASTFTLVYREAFRRGRSRLIALSVVGMAAAASSIHWLARPHLFTLLLLAIWTPQLERSVKNNSGRIWLFPIIMLVWVNLHGAFIAGFLILIIFLIEWILNYWRGTAPSTAGINLGLIAVTSFLSTLINPAGWRLWATSLGYIANDYLVGHTVEYLPPDFHNMRTWPFLLIISLALFGLTFGRQLSLHDGILMAAWTVMSLYSARNIPLFAVISAPIMAELLQTIAGAFCWIEKFEQGMEKIEIQLRGIFWPSLAVISLLLLFSRHIPLDLMQNGNSFDPAVFPVHAVDWLEQNPQEGKMFNYFTWGGYLLFRTWPEQKVFIDGQTDFYGEALTRDYERVISLAPRCQETLDRFEINWVIMPTHSALSNALQDAGWDTIYQDSTAVILRRP